MDILRPQLTWINGACYRKFGSNRGNANTNGGDTADAYDDDEPMCSSPMDDVEIGDDCDITVEDLDSGRFKYSGHIPSAFFPHIIGKKGVTKKRVETETNTRISIPRQGEEGDVCITGSDKIGVVRAWNRLVVIVESSRAKQEFTHFISLPLNSADMQNTFLELKEDIMRKCYQAHGVDETIFQSPGLLHLTIGTMVLLDVQESQKAIDILQDCYETIYLPLYGPNPIDLEIVGLEIMNDDPGDVDVLYAKIDPLALGKLQMLADQLVDCFVRAGLMSRRYDRVKLHLTLMNSLFRRDDGGIAENETNRSQSQTKGGTKTRESFDARPILEAFGGRRLGDTQVTEIHLSQRRAERKTKENYYWPSCVVTLNECA